MLRLEDMLRIVEGSCCLETTDGTDPLESGDLGAVVKLFIGSSLEVNQWQSNRVNSEFVVSFALDSLVSQNIQRMLR